MSFLRGLSTNTHRIACTSTPLSAPSLTAHWGPECLGHLIRYCDLQPSPPGWLASYTNPLLRQWWLARLVKGAVVYNVNPRLIHLPPHHPVVFALTLFVFYYLGIRCMSDAHPASTKSFTFKFPCKEEYHVALIMDVLKCDVMLKTTASLPVWKWARTTCKSNIRSDADKRVTHLRKLSQWTD